MAAGPNKDMVLVEYDYEYTGRDGGLVSIKPNECYFLLCKTNDHWWHVCKDKKSRPFYIPAKYVKLLPSVCPSPLSTVPSNGLDPTEPVITHQTTENSFEQKQEVSIRVPPPVNFNKKPEVRLSTFGVPQDLQGIHHILSMQSHDSNSTSSSFSKNASDNTRRLSLAPGVFLGSRPMDVQAEPIMLRQPKPVRTPTIDGIEQRALSKAVQQVEKLENVYEGIPDILNIRPKSLKDIATTSVVPTPSPVSLHVSQCKKAVEPVQAPFPSSKQLTPQVLGAALTFSQAKQESPETAVYVNAEEIRKCLPLSPPVSSVSPQSPRHLSLDLEGWEIHTDQESGQAYYYHPDTGQTTWDYPFSSSTDPELPASPCRPSPSPLVCTTDWEKVFDESSGQHYFYNAVSGETTWELPEELIPSMEPFGPLKQVEHPPLPEEDYPVDAQEEPGVLLSFPNEQYYAQVNRPAIPRASIDMRAPDGWICSRDPDGKCIFTNEVTQEQWIKSLDERGQSYYYTRDGSKSQWSLPENPSASSPPKVGNGLDQEGVTVIKNWRHTMAPSSSVHGDVKFFHTHRRNISDHGSDASSSGNSPELPHHADRFRYQRSYSSQSCESQHQNVLEKAGILNKTKVFDNGKKVRKNWTQSWTVLHGGILTFHKDPKSAPSGVSNKSNQIVPEFTVELRGATIIWATKEKSSKKNVLELKTRAGAEFLIQYDTDSIINDWHKVITETIQQLDQQYEVEDADVDEKKVISMRHGSMSSSNDPEQKKVRAKLLKFLQKRPTLQAVKDKGYIQDNVFGCALDILCTREKTTVPTFVEKCIRAVENRGLDIDGLYRVSGNLAVIQKLRFKADHEELDLEDGQWEDVHVITGALKLFFRELPEPLFPFSYFNNFIAAINISEYTQKVAYMRELVQSLPTPNRDTMELLFRHLRNVIQYGEENRMSVQNVSIVFGPTLLRPEMESANIAMYMVFQNQIVEFILNEYEHVFFRG